MAGLGCGAKDIAKDVGNLQVGYIQVQLQGATGNSVSSMELRPLEMRANMAEVAQQDGWSKSKLN